MTPAPAPAPIIINNAPPLSPPSSTPSTPIIRQSSPSLSPQSPRWWVVRLSRHQRKYQFSRLWWLVIGWVSSSATTISSFIDLSIIRNRRSTRSTRLNGEWSGRRSKNRHKRCVGLIVIHWGMVTGTAGAGVFHNFYSFLYFSSNYRHFIIFHLHEKFWWK